LQELLGVITEGKKVIEENFGKVSSAAFDQSRLDSFSARLAVLMNQRDRARANLVRLRRLKKC
jgi:hypothetical protein